MFGLLTWLLACAGCVECTATRIRTEMWSSAISGVCWDDPVFTASEPGRPYAGRAIHLEHWQEMYVPLTIQECQFRNCQNGLSEVGQKEVALQQGGGAIYACRHNIHLIQTEFTNCVAHKGRGGAIHLRRVETFKMEWCTFSQCSATGNSTTNSSAGAVYSDQGSFEASNCTFTDCTSTCEGDFTKLGGGCIEHCSFDSQNPKLVLSYCHFTNCKVTGNAGAGGAVYSCSLNCTGCDFTTVNAPTQGGVILATGNDVTLDGCKFSKCSRGDGGAIIRFSAQGIVFKCSEVTFTECNKTFGFEHACSSTSFSISQATFDNCHSTGQIIMGIDSQYGEFAAVSLQHCKVTNCVAKDSIFFCWCNSLVLQDITVNCNYGFAKIFTVGLSTEGEIVFDHCSVSNGGTKLSEWCVNTFADGKCTKFAFNHCSFDGVFSQRSGGALNIGGTYNAAKAFTGTLELVECKFTECQTVNDAGAVNTQKARTVIVTNCEFKNCKSTTGYTCGSAGGGALTVESHATSVTLSNVTFSGNSHPKQSMSLHVMWTTEQRDRTRVTLKDCKFTDHTAGDKELISYGCYEPNSDCNLGTYPDEMIISGCIFENNQFEEGGQIFSCESLIGVAYENCKFTSNSGYGLIAATALTFEPQIPPPSLIMRDCQFSGCNCDAGIIFGVESREFSALTMENCRFIKCSGAVISMQLASGTDIWLNNNVFDGCKPLQDKPCSVFHNLSMFKSVTLTGNVFTNCEGYENVVPLDAGTTYEKVELSNCSFTAVTTASGVVLAAPEHGTTIPNIKIATCKFDSCVATSGSILTLYSQSVTLELNTCVMNTTQQTKSPFVISVNQQSDISGTLFDTQQDIKQPLIDLTCENGAGVNFYNCCFTHAFDEGQVSGLYMHVHKGVIDFLFTCFDVSNSSAISFDEGASFTDSGNTSFEYCECWIYIDPTEEDHSNSNKAGLIAGVTIGILILIAVIVVVILLLLWRRRSTSTSTGGADDQQTNTGDYPEETMTSTDLDRGGTDLVVTEDNPMFVSEQFATGDAFRPAYEESNFYTGA